MKPYIIILCLLFTGCVTKEMGQYILDRTKVNAENNETVQKDLQDHFTQDHEIDRQVSKLKEQPEAPKLNNSFIVRAIRFVTTFGGSINPVIGIAGSWILGALPFIFGKPEEE